MSFVHHALRVFSAALALTAIAACSDDDPDPNGAGSGAGTTSAGGGGTLAGQGGMSAGEGGGGGTSGTSAGTSAGAGAGGEGGAGVGGSGASSGEGGSAGTSAGAGGSELDAGIDAGPITECVVATRLDDCCPRWYAVSRDEALSDPCLRAIGEIPANDVDCTPQVCTDVLCPEFGEPPSRVAKPINGECMFFDECDAEASCVTALDLTQCCPCLTSMPKQLVDREPCLIEASMSARPAACNVPCPLIACGECPEQPEPTCLVRDSASLCR